MTSRLDAVEKVFGLPNTWTVQPRTFGEMNPAQEMRNLAQEQAHSSCSGATSSLDENMTTVDDYPDAKIVRLQVRVNSLNVNHVVHKLSEFAQANDLESTVNGVFAGWEIQVEGEDTWVIS